MKSTLSLSVAACAVVFCFFFQSPASAEKMEAPLVPLKVGSLEVYAVQDRATEMDVSLFSGPASPEQRKALMPSGKARASVNVFLVKKGPQVILFDAGWGRGKEGGRLPADLSRAGVKPEDVSLVLLTHMHMDHIAGLLDGGKAVYPKAVVAPSETESRFWLGPEMRAQKDNKNAALVKELEGVYGMRLRAFGESMTPEEALAGTRNKALGEFGFPAEIFPIAAPGHTPGHTAYLVQSEGERLLVIGDLLHAADLQFPLPDECASFDRDKAEAVKSRRALLAFAAKHDIPVAGMHLPYPSGVGRVKDDGKGGFAFVPLNF